jgi:hypothetical protein
MRGAAIVFVGLVIVGFFWIMVEAVEHDNAWERDRDDCIRRGGIPVHMHLPDGRMAACAQSISVGG